MFFPVPSLNYSGDPAGAQEATIWDMDGLLLILAHPDDETFFAGGAIARYASANVRVGLVCATRGERGATGNLCSIEELPRVREGELRDAARILGVRDLSLLPYQDQKLWAAPADEIRRYIVTAIRAQRPRIVITFDPNGANQHSDHIAISRFAMDAIAAAADPRWYSETGAAHLVERVLWPAPIVPFELSRAKNAARQPGVDFLLDAGEFRESKRAALRAHRTQFPGLSRIFNSDASISWEAFRVGCGARPKSPPLNDLFAA
jgi:LmbE family N-acetylglucosaminyl deacetylase